MRWKIDSQTDGRESPIAPKKGWSVQSGKDFQRGTTAISTTRAFAHRVGIHLPIENLSGDVFKRLLSVFEGDKDSLLSLTEAERSALYGLVEVGAFYVYPETFESYLQPRPDDEAAGPLYDAERDATHPARRFARSPDTIEGSLASLGQSALLEEFRLIYAGPIERLRELRRQHGGLD